MRNHKILPFILIILFVLSCAKEKTAIDILQNTILSIDSIESKYYKQDMSRTNPQNSTDTITRYREMYFKRLVSDSIVGVKGHWYMYIDDKVNVVFEDIFDGNILVRKNNRDSIARVYDLIKYPDFKKKHFWGHNTLYGMQYELKYVLENWDSYSINSLNDTILNNTECYQLIIELKDHVSMPGFATKLEKQEGVISKTWYFIDKKTSYPVAIKGESYTQELPESRVFIEQVYYDVNFNLPIKENKQFDTSLASLAGYEIVEMEP